MKRSNKIILTSVIVAVLLLGIGYAAIQNITLNIAGSAAADPSQANFKVMFSGTPTVSDNTYVTAAITDDTNATVNVEGLTKKGDIVTATYTVQNASTDLSADLGISTTNDNTEFFTLSSELAQTSLVAGEATTLTVTVKLTKTPITDSVSTTIGVQLEAMPVQPGEEGTSDGINGSSQTPNGTNKYGFYYDKFYANQDEGFGYIAHEDGSLEMFQYILAEEVTGLTSDEWICINYVPAGEIDFDEMIADGVTASKEGKIINMNGIGYELTDIENHGIYFGSEYTVAIDDTMSYEMIIEKDGSVKLTVYENGVIAGVEEVPNAFAPVANNYMMLMSNNVALTLNVTGEKLYWYDMEMEFTLTGRKCDYIEEIIKEPNYSNGECVDGEMKYTCPVCGDSYITPITAVHPDEDIDGICDNCGESITYTDFTLNSSNAYMIGYTQETTDLFIPATFYNEKDDTYYKITYVSNYTFEEETNLKTVTFADNSRVSSIGRDAFEDCTNLTSINIPDSVTSIGEYCFENCTALENVIFGDDSPITTIDEYTFKNCTSLSNIKIPKNVTSIEGGLFDGCTSLSNIEIFKSVTSINKSAFNGCKNLTIIEVDTDNTVYASFDGILYNKDMTTLVECPAGKVGAVDIPESVTDIEYSAFSNCTKLTNIKMSDNIESIGQYAFENCTSLTSVGPVGSGASIEIPDKINSYSVHMFTGCTGLTSVVLSKGISKISYWAFQDCTNLTNVTFNNRITTIGQEAFKNCPKLTNITFPDSITSIGSSAFNGCESLTSVEIPSKVKEIEWGTFGDCTNLESITIHENVTSISGNAFDNTPWLAAQQAINPLVIINNMLVNGVATSGNVVIPDGVISIQEYAFDEGVSSSDLTSVVIPESVTKIDSYAFNWCSNLKSIMIPRSVTSIGYGAFYWCNSLVTVNYTGTEEQWNAISIDTSNDDLIEATINYNYVIPTE